MTQQPDATPEVVAGSGQAATAVSPSPVPAKATPPPQPAQDPSTRAAELEDELAALRAETRGPDTVRLRVEGAHSGLIHNGLYVGTDWTEVPSHVVPAIMEGAANSGVTLVQEETES